jgi:hypothetical protein
LEPTLLSYRAVVTLRGAVAGLMALVIGAGALAGCSDDDDAVTTAVASSVAASEAELDAVVAELSAFVEQERELQFEEPVRVELADDAEFEQRLLDDFEEEDEADVRKTEGVLRALGFLDASDDLLEQVRGVASAGVVGFYDPTTNELVVRGTEVTPYVRRVITHELVHALDDQHFELHRPELDDRKDESGLGFSVLTEGDAERVADAYEEQLSASERKELEQADAALGAETDLTQFAPIVLAMIAAPYQLGPPLLDGLIAAGGQAAVDAAFTDPPTTSEQVLRPDKYLDREPAIEVAVPEADGEPLDDGTYGQLLLALQLTLGGVPADEAGAAIDGWGGDHYVTWADGDRTCIRTRFVTDQDGDVAELAAALETWAADRPDAVVDVADDGVTFTSCG